MHTTDQARSFQQQLDDSEITPVMWLVWVLSAGLIALDGFDFFIIGVALPFIEQDFHLSSTEVGAIAVAAIVGSLVGSLTLGPITDKVGRQRMLLVDIVLFVVATAGTAFAWDAVSLIGFRFLVGVAIGADYPISVAYITENVPTRSRGRMVIGAFTFQAVGALLGALTGVIILQISGALQPNSLDLAAHTAWRWMLGVGLIFAIAVGIFRFSFKLESPRYHLAKGDYDAASKAATMLLDTPIEFTPNATADEPEVQLSYQALFSPQFRQNLLLASLPWFLQDIATYGIGIFTPTIIGALAFADEPSFIVRQIASAKGAAIVDLFLIAGFLLAVILVERVGRIPLQIAGFLGMTAGLLILAGSGIGTFAPNFTTALVFLGFFTFNLMMNAGPNATTFLLAGEVFPTTIRATGAGIAGAIAKAGAVLGTFALPLLQQVWGVPFLLVGLALCCLVAAGLTYRLRIETTGRSLEGINSSKSESDLM